MQARAEGQPAVSGRECCLFLSNGAEGDGSLSRSRIGKGPERGDRRETACGGSETFFLFFFPVLLLLRQRAIEEVDNGKIAHALSTCFLHLHSTPKSQHATFSVVKASESFWTLGEEAGSIG